MSSAEPLTVEAWLLNSLDTSVFQLLLIANLPGLTIDFSQVCRFRGGVERGV